MRGFPTGYDDLRVTAFSQGVAGTPNLTNYGGGTYPVQAWAYANDGNERGLEATTQWPHTLLQATSGVAYPIYIHVHMSTTNATLAGVVLGFFVSVRFQKIGSAAPFEGVYWCSKTVPVGGYAAKQIVDTVDVPIDLTQVAPSGMIWIYAFRDKGAVVATVNAGNVTEDVNDVLWLHEVDFHIKTGPAGGPTPAPPWL